MNIRLLLTFSTSLLLSAIWTAPARADIPPGLIDLIHETDVILCDYVGADGYCTADFTGAFGAASDTFKGSRTKDRTNRTRTCPTDVNWDHPIEDSHCNETDSKAEWRHDSLKLKLESALQEYAKDRLDAGDLYFCTFLGDAELMNSKNQLSDSGYAALMTIAGAIVASQGIVCDAE